MPILVGPAAKIREVREGARHRSRSARASSTRRTATRRRRRPSSWCAQGEAELLMKGSLHSDELLGAVVARETGLRTGRRISHVFIMDVPTYHKVLIVTDAAINIAPTLEDKVDICQNAIDLGDVARRLGSRRSRSSRRSRPSTSKMPATIDAAALCKMADRGQITGGAARRPAGVRQRDQQRGGEDQGHQVGGRRRSRHPARARSRGRQHARQAAHLPGQRRQRRPRARRARADHPDEPRRQRAIADRELRRRDARRARAAAGSCRRRRRVTAGMDDYAVVLNAGSSSLKFCVYRRPDGATRGRSTRAGRSTASARRRDSRRRTAQATRASRRSPGSTGRSTTAGRRLDALADVAARALSAARACSASAIASCTAARSTPARRSSRRRSSTDLRALDAAGAASSAVQPRRHRRRRPSDCRTCRRSPASTPAFIAGSRRSPRWCRCRARFADGGVQRYGFHGLSYEYIASVLPDVAPEIAHGRVIVAHLGSGASLCAMKNRQERRQHARLHRARRPVHGDAARTRSIRAWFSISSRRSGSRRRTSRRCSTRSRGCSAFPASATTCATCSRAASRTRGSRWTTSCISAAKQIGALAAVLGGVDGLVFTAGIGENSPEIRNRICDASAWLGIELDAGRQRTRAADLRRAVACRRG